jgi:hypothetical protein
MFVPGENVDFCIRFLNDCDCGVKRLQSVMIRYEQRRNFEFFRDCVSFSSSVCVISENKPRCSSTRVKLSRSEAEVLSSSAEFKSEGVIPPIPHTPPWRA